MPVTITIEGLNAEEVRKQMWTLLNGDPSAAYPTTRKAAEAAMANAEQYDADKAAKEQREKDLSADRAAERADSISAQIEKVEKTTRQRKPKEEPAAEPVAEQAQEPATEKAASAPAVTLDYTKDIAPAVIAYNTKNGREATIALLGEFGASNAKDIKPDLWPELLERLS